MKLANIVKVLQGMSSEQATQIRREYVYKNNRLYRKVDDQLRFVVPTAMRWRVVPVRTPRANGSIERINQTVCKCLRASCVSDSDWDAAIRDIQWTLNSNTNATTKYSPNDLIFDFRLRDVVHNRLVQAIHDKTNDSQESIDIRRERATKAIEAEQAKWKQRFDRQRKKPSQYQEGDLVVNTNVAPSTGFSRKLEPRYRGPYVISKVLRFDRYVVEDIEGLQRRQRRFNSVFHAEHLKPWCTAAPFLDNDTDGSDNEEDPGNVPGQEWPNCHKRAIVTTMGSKRVEFETPTDMDHNMFRV
ncbi:uncharacterized protein LOC119659126 [Hermetia illucens]|nr:uncharacterized protein LOC119659126 [Hermetia illucens]